MDLRKIDFVNEFHAIFNWFGSFGYFSDEENLDLLRRFARALRPDGQLLIDQTNRESVLRNFHSKCDDGNLKRRMKWNSEKHCVEGIWTITNIKSRKNNPISMRLYTPGQLKKMFKKVGLKIETMYGSWTGGPYRRGSKRLVIVGKKRK